VKHRPILKTKLSIADTQDDEQEDIVCCLCMAEATHLMNGRHYCDDCYEEEYYATADKDPG
jgi:predicted amidophosphoribosyltransferase